MGNLGLWISFGIPLLCTRYLHLKGAPLLGRLIEACFAVEILCKNQMIGYHNRTLGTKN